MSPADVAAARPPTGGVPATALDGKRWFLLVARRVERSVRTVADDDHGGPVRLDLRGPRARDWRRWRWAADVRIQRDGPLDLAVDVDVTAGLDHDTARRQVAGQLDRLVPGGRLVVVERVVPRPDDRGVRGVRELLALVTLAAGTAITLEHVESLVRPGEWYPTTVVLEFVRLRAP